MKKFLPKISKEGRWQRLFVVGVFFVTVSIGLVIGFSRGNVSVTPYDQSSATSLTNAVSMASYQVEAAQVVAPLFSSVTVSDEWLAPNVDELKTVVQIGRERLLAMRVPASAKGVHMEIFLLYERWNQVLLGNGDISAVRAATEKLIDQQPWLAATASVIKASGE